jgi:outer membrane protein TolC
LAIAGLLSAISCAEQAVCDANDDPGLRAAQAGSSALEAAVAQDPPSAKQGPELIHPPREAADAMPGEELSLTDAIGLASAANPDVKSALERTRIAEAVLANARAQFYPTLTAIQEYQVSDNPLREFSYLLSQGVVDPNQLFPLPDVRDNFHTQLHLQEDLYTGGLRRARARAAEADSEAAHYSLAAVRNQLVFQVAESYYRVFQARALVGVRRETVALLESQLKVVQSRFAANTAVKSDVLRVEVRLAESRENLITATNAFELAKAVLENVLGTRIGGRPLPQQLPAAPWSEQIDRKAAALAAVLGSPEAVEGAVDEAVQQRPEMKETASLRAAAEHQVRAAQSAKYPTVGVVGDFDLNAQDLRKGDASYFFGIALSLNLFDGHRTQTSVRQAEARVREISARSERVKLDIELDVRRAYLQLKDARERLKVTASTLAYAEENLRQVEARFRRETATTTELLDAQVVLSDARVRSISTAADVEIARASLERALGRLSDLLNGCNEPHE